MDNVAYIEESLKGIESSLGQEIAQETLDYLLKKGGLWKKVFETMHREDTFTLDDLECSSMLYDSVLNIEYGAWYNEEGVNNPPYALLENASSTVRTSFENTLKGLLSEAVLPVVDLTFRIQDFTPQGGKTLYCVDIEFDTSEFDI